MSSFGSFLHDASSFYGQLVVVIAAMHGVHAIEPLARKYDCS